MIKITHTCTVTHILFITMLNVACLTKLQTRSFVFYNEMSFLLVALVFQCYCLNEVEILLAIVTALLFTFKIIFELNHDDWYYFYYDMFVVLGHIFPKCLTRCPSG